jgi:hypothetical protein
MASRVPPLDLSGFSDRKAPLSPRGSADKRSQAAQATWAEALSPRRRATTEVASPRPTPTLQQLMTGKSDDVAALFHSIMSPRRSVASPRAAPIEEPDPTAKDLEVISSALSHMRKNPSLAGLSGTVMGDRILRNHVKILGPIIACIEDVKYRWNLEIDNFNQKTPEKEVEWALAKKTIKSLVALSEQLLTRLPKYKLSSQLKSALNSPRRPKEKQITQEQVTVSHFVAKEDQIVQDLIPFFTDAAKTYFGALDIMIHRHDQDSLIDKYFTRRKAASSPNLEILSPRGPREVHSLSAPELPIPEAAPPPAAPAQPAQTGLQKLMSFLTRATDKS